MKRTAATLAAAGMLMVAASAVAQAAAAPAANAAPATAVSAARMAKAEEMLRLTKTDALMQEQLANLHERVVGMATQQSAMPDQNDAQKKLSAEYVKEVGAIDDKEVGWAEVRPTIVQTYAETFTEAELDAIIAFYKSPAGQAIVNKTPQVADKTMTLVQGRIRAMQPKLEAVTKEYAANLAKISPAKPTTDAPMPPRPAAASPRTEPIK